MQNLIRLIIVCSVCNPCLQYLGVLYHSKILMHVLLILDRQLRANSADPDQTDNCLLCLQSLSAVSRSIIT